VSLDKSFIVEFQDYRWDSNFTVSELSEEFIQEVYDKLDWKEISQYQNVSERFIEDFQ
jgi:hypothetical protein